MSTSESNKLWLRPYDEIDTSVPDCRVTCLPGRIAALTHPLNAGREIKLADRETFDPDVCVVVSSGVTGFDPADVIVLKPDHGAFYDRLSPDGRELRIIGVAKPWWESVLAKFGPEGIAPAPGFMLIERDPHPDHIQSFLYLPDNAPKFGDSGTVLASCADHWATLYEGERVSIAGFRTYTFDSVVPESWCLVQAPMVSKSWLNTLSKTAA